MDGQALPTTAAQPGSVVRAETPLLEGGNCVEFAQSLQSGMPVHCRRATLLLNGACAKHRLVPERDLPFS